MKTRATVLCERKKKKIYPQYWSGRVNMMSIMDVVIINDMLSVTLHLHSSYYPIDRQY